MALSKKIRAYLAMPYTRTVRTVADGDEHYFVAAIEELPGVEAGAETPYEAYYNLQLAFEDYLAAMVEWGESIPEPRSWPYSELEFLSPLVRSENVHRPEELADLVELRDVEEEGLVLIA